MFDKPIFRQHWRDVVVAKQAHQGNRDRAKMQVSRMPALSNGCIVEWGNESGMEYFAAWADHLSNSRPSITE